MIIHQPELLKRDGHTIIYSKIEMCQQRENFPEHLWYKVPDKFARYLSLQSDAFLIPGLLAGMHFQEAIEVRGMVSPKLAYKLDEYQHLLHFKMPKAVSPVEIKYSQLKSLQASPTAVGTTFSGGVDSFFTLWKHLPENQPIPDYHITHALFILGFDIMNSEKEKYRSLFSRFHDALKQIDIELIPLETNIASLIIPRMKFTLLFSPILIGAAHVLGCLFRRFLIPGSIDYRQIQIWPSSSDPTSDPLQSTETLDIIHFGATHCRVEKIKVISDWDLPQKHLRVCTKNDSDSLNCSHCEKCVRTLIPIFALGKMKCFSTFEKPFTSNLDALRWARKFDPFSPFVEEIIPFTRKYEPDLIPWLKLAALIGYLRYWFLKLIPGFLKKWLQRFGYFIDPLIQDQAFDDLEVIRYIKSSNSNEF